MKSTRFMLTGALVALLAPGLAFTQEPDADAPSAAAAAVANAGQSESPVLVGAGDIANCEVGDGHMKTAEVVEGIAGTVFTMGDHAYPSGARKSFEDCYGKSWGRFKDRTRPSPGNHDMRTNNGAPYYKYFGENAGPRGRGYYSYDLGEWHIVSLNSDAPAHERSKQIEWLREDLAANPGVCTLAYWHVPVFSSGGHGNNPEMAYAWQVLSEFGADVIVNGHDHQYERFAPQDAAGNPDPERGIRQFVVGTGGAGVYSFKTLAANSEVRHWKSYGVIKFTLHPESYDWEFLRAAGEPFEDKGSAACIK